MELELLFDLLCFIKKFGNGTHLRLVYITLSCFTTFVTRPTVMGWDTRSATTATLRKLVLYIVISIVIGDEQGVYNYCYSKKVVEVLGVYSCCYTTGFSVEMGSRGCSLTGIWE